MDGRARYRLPARLPTTHSRTAHTESPRNPRFSRKCLPGKTGPAPTKKRQGQTEAELPGLHAVITLRERAGKIHLQLETPAKTGAHPGNDETEPELGPQSESGSEFVILIIHG